MKELTQNQIYFLKRNLNIFTVGFLPDPPPKERFLLVLFAKIKKISFFFDLFSLIFKLLNAPKNSVLIFNHSKRVRMTEGGKTSIYLNSLLKTMPLSKFIVVEDSKVSLEYPHNAFVISSESISFFANLVSRFSSDRPLNIFKIKLFLWRNIFRFLKPKKIFLIVWYGKEWAIAAAKLNGIEVVDLQHGVVYEHHHAYNIDAGRDIEDSHFLLPDSCWVYGEYWKEEMIKAGWPAEKLKVGGYYLDVGQKKEKKIGFPYILYTSQPGAYPQIMSHIESIRQSLEERGLKAIIALHPSEDGSEYDGFVGDIAHILSGYDSYDLLRDCVSHLSISSTLLFESLLMGKTSYVLESNKYLPPQIFIESLIERGVFRRAKTGEYPHPFQLPVNTNVNYFFDQTRFAELLSSSQPS